TMLTVESSGSVLANVMPLAAGETDSNSGGAAGALKRPQRTPASAGAAGAAGAIRNHRVFWKGRQDSVKTLALLLAPLLCVGGCRAKRVDTGALITARTVGLEPPQRGRLPEAEQSFRTVIQLVPRDPLGYANLGLTYLRAGRYREAEPQLERARRLDPASV